MDELPASEMAKDPAAVSAKTIQEVEDAEEVGTYLFMYYIHTLSNQPLPSPLHTCTDSWLGSVLRPAPTARPWRQPGGLKPTLLT
jgi:hypothetical protein